MNTAFEKGKVSLIILTFNRSQMITDAIDSLLNQTYENTEIIIVDNASTDDTAKVLERYKSPEFQDKIRIYHLEENRKFTGGTNFALDKIRGEWFTLLDDDDTAHPEALEIMLSIPREIDPTIDAITCNAIDSSTGELAGKGLEKDQYLSFEHLVRHCSGEFWGITKSELIRGIRFNEALIGMEDTFWYKVSAKANRYYVHKGLRVWTTDHGTNMTTILKRKNRKLKAKVYRALVHEDLYWDSLATYDVKKFRSKCLKGLIYTHMDEDPQTAGMYLVKLSEHAGLSIVIGKISMIMPRALLRSVFYFIPL